MFILGEVKSIIAQFSLKLCSFKAVLRNIGEYNSSLFMLELME